MKYEKTRTYGDSSTRATCSARRNLSRCGTKSSLIGTLPMGEPTEETPIPRSDIAAPTFRISSSVRSSTFLFQTLLSSTKRIDSPVSVSSCSSNSGEISSAKPVRVHINHDLLIATGAYHRLALDTPDGRVTDEVASKDHGRGVRGVFLLSNFPGRLPFPDAHGLAGAGRLVDAGDDRERLASFFDGYGGLAVVLDGPDEVRDLVPVRHREAFGIGAGARSRGAFPVLLHDPLSLVVTSPVGLRLLLHPSGVEVHELVVIDHGRAPVPVHGYPGREAGVSGGRGRDGGEGAVLEFEDRHGGVLDLDPLVGEQAGVGGDLDDAAHQPLQEVDAVYGLVNQDPPAVQLPRAAPPARVVIGLRPPPPHLRRPHGQAAELLPGDRAVDGQGRRVEAVLAYNGHLPAGRPLYFEKPVRRLERDVDGLFDDDVFARF